MFDRIGQKVKTIAKVLFIIGIVVYCIIGIMLAKLYDSFLAFLLVGGIGVLLSYLSVIVLYMLGQLVDNSDTIAENSKKQVQLLNSILKATQSAAPIPSDTNGQNTKAEDAPYVCSCGTKITDPELKFCPQCGKKIEKRPHYLKGVCPACGNYRNNGAFCAVCGHAIPPSE